MDVDRYFDSLAEEVDYAYLIANAARASGLDPAKKVEIPLATSLAERAVGLISTIYSQINTPELVQRILSLEDQYGKLDPAICLKIAEEIAQQKFCNFESPLQAIDAGIRIGMAYITLGVVSSPIEGFTELKAKKRRDDGEFFAAYYAGPIRSAGGTGAAFSLVIVDHLREFFGYQPYDPDEKEIKRAVTEMNDYHERITNLQYLPSEKEALFLFKGIPIQVTGDPSEDKEVSNYKDLDRVETNFIRSGFCLTFAEGLAQKAPKILKMVKKLREKGFKLTNWDFLEEFVEYQKKLKEEKKKESNTATYIQDIVAGRPVLGHPGASGSFRLRYGRSRGTGFSALGMHPATMHVLDNFIAIGSQLKIEKPTKGASMSVCDSIDGPIAKLLSGSVRRLSYEEAKQGYKQIGEILYLGDLLVPYGDFANRNHALLPAGYCEEWWEQELKKEAGAGFEQLPSEDVLGSLFSQKKKIDFATAISLSEKYKIPLYPSFIHFWTQISFEEFLALLDWLGHGIVHGKVLLPFGKSEKERFQRGKRALELLGAEHEVTTEHVVLAEEESKAFLTQLGISATLVQSQNFSLEGVMHEVMQKVKEISSLLEAKAASENKNLEDGKKILEIIRGLSKYLVRDKAGTFIGARMGRPEKAKLRKLIGSPHTLFPVGEEGGRLRSLNAAVAVGSVKGDFPLFYCDSCKKEGIYGKCEVCSRECKRIFYCPDCQSTMENSCTLHGKSARHMTRRIDVKHYLNTAVKYLRLEQTPELIKGVRGTSSKDHFTEHLCKGVLRAVYGLHVNKDGTIRFDATELPLTHFKPFEIGTSIEKLKELGYSEDADGKPLERDDQILEMMPHDLLLPSCPESPDERADDVFLKIARFVDDLLMRFYKTEPFYQASRREDLIGHLVACIAPHNCASVVGRIIGFSKVQALLASPYMHAAMRRDCDGDEAAVMLLMDMLLNFSREFLPAHRGGTQDTPLVLNSRIRAGEVDDMIFDFDVSHEIPLELYASADRGEHPSKVKMEQVRDRIGKDEFRNIGYTHETQDLHQGVLCCSYKKLATMQEKVEREMALVEKIRAVKTSDVARLIIERHFIRDIRGNLRKFSSQEFRCVKCNEKYRRPPLAGNCTKCQGRIIFTISHGSIIKYLEPALKLAEKYDVPIYLKQSLELTKSYIESIFGREKEKQEGLKKWL